jgi:hypothetical protein
MAAELPWPIDASPLCSAHSLRGSAAIIAVRPPAATGLDIVVLPIGAHAPITTGYLLLHLRA